MLPYVGRRNPGYVGRRNPGYVGMRNPGYVGKWETVVSMSVQE